jgi:hypothetical protein
MYVGDRILLHVSLDATRRQLQRLTQTPSC